MADSFTVASPNLDLTLPRESLLLSRARALVKTSDSGKIDKAARDFESILLNQWLEQAREAFAGVPGGDEEDGDDPGRGQLQSLGMQSLATAITKSGGIGIATLISRHLRQQDANGQQGATPTGRSSSGGPEAVKSAAPSYVETLKK